MAWINLLDLIYPIGSFYFSNQLNQSPSAIIGGTWEKIENAVLRGADEIGYIGSDTYTLTIDEMPSHNHTSDVQSNADWGVAVVNGGGMNGDIEVNWGDGILVGVGYSEVGGGLHTQLCNALTTVIFGQELLNKFNKRGEINVLFC